MKTILTLATTTNDVWSVKFSDMHHPYYYFVYLNNEHITSRKKAKQAIKYVLENVDYTKL